MARFLVAKSPAFLMSPLVARFVEAIAEDCFRLVLPEFAFDPPVDGPPAARVASAVGAGIGIAAIRSIEIGDSRGFIPIRNQDLCYFALPGDPTPGLLSTKWREEFSNARRA